jgi:hypothetical protein
MFTLITWEAMLVTIGAPGSRKVLPGNPSREIGRETNNYFFVFTLVISKTVTFRVDTV